MVFLHELGFHVFDILLIRPVVILASVLGLLVVAGYATKPDKDISAIQKTFYLVAAAAE